MRIDPRMIGCIFPGHYDCLAPELPRDKTDLHRVPPMLMDPLVLNAESTLWTVFEHRYSYNQLGAFTCCVALRY